MALIFEQLGTLLQSIEPAAHLVEPRILRRVIRLDQRLPGLGLTVPHRKSYTIERDRLLAFVDRTELDLPPAADLPPVVILLTRPEDDDALDPRHVEEVLHCYARLLFHASVHKELERRAADEESLSAWAAERRAQIGAAEFAEMRSVLLKDEYLFPQASDLDTYVEFVSVYLELRYFAAEDLGINFPAVRDWSAIDTIVSQDIDHKRLFTRITALQELADDFPDPPPSETDTIVRTRTGDVVALAQFRQMQARAERAAALGNGVKAAISHTRAAHRAPQGYAAEAHAAARQELRRVVDRLQKVLNFNDDIADEWSEALEPLLGPAAEGFWSAEARLLYDLQKVCIEQERGVYRLDLVEWIRTRGQRPIRRQLPLLRDVLMIRHLRTANRRIAAARLRPRERQRLALLIAAELPHLELAMRDRLRPLIVQALDGVELVPHHVPEDVARRKLIEELLDRVIEHSYLNMAHLRDALSKNDLKLPDVTRVVDLLFGDRLLRADRAFDQSLDGVYRRGTFYQRWPQSISSLAFGTRFGRFLTKHLALPFGGAFLGLAFIQHEFAMLQGEDHTPGTTPGTTPHSFSFSFASIDWSFYAIVLVLGTWISLLMHRPAFRAWNIAILRGVWRIGKQAFYELPAAVLRSKVVQQVLNSQTYAAVHSYVIRPAMFIGVFWVASLAVGQRFAARTVFEAFLVMALFLNSSIGRYATEVSTDFLVRAWHELRMRVFSAILRAIIDFFHTLIVALERLVYWVDEWLRFRAGDNRAMQSLKLLGGVGWFFVSYVVVFVFMVLFEPQINPIKHFPVVTVSHKLIALTGPIFVKQFVQPSPDFWWPFPAMSKASANTLVWTTIWLIPGMFGYLVWELKENWRLYAANRQRKLHSVLIGDHGETMLRLLRPGFHSGTLPKAYAGLRRAVRKAQGVEDVNRVHRKQAAIHHVEHAVQRFVERELLFLLELADFLPSAAIEVGEVRTATNRIDVELVQDGDREQAAHVTFEDDAGALRGLVSRAGWIEELSPADRELLTTALAGLFLRAGIDDTNGQVPVSLAPIAWQEWVDYWQRTPEGAVIRLPLVEAPVLPASPEAAAPPPDQETRETG